MREYTRLFKPTLFFFLSNIIIFINPAQAELLVPKVSGFLTSGVTVSSENEPILESYEVVNEASFRNDTVLGLQFDTKLDDEWRMSAQLVANNAGNKFEVDADWLYVAWEPSYNTMIRAGRLRIPAYMYSDFFYVGNSTPWARLPQEVYGLVPQTRYAGIDLIQYFEIGDGRLMFQLFYGQANENNMIAGIPNTTLDQHLGGLKTMFEISGFKLVATVVDVRPSFTATFPPLGLPDTLHAQFYNLGGSYSGESFEIISEVSFIEADKIFGQVVSGYVTYVQNMGQYSPYVTLAHIDSSDGAAILRDSDSFALGIRNDITPRVTLKAEVQQFERKHDTIGMFLMPDVTIVAPPPSPPEQIQNAIDALPEDATIFTATVNVIF